MLQLKIGDRVWLPREKREGEVVKPETRGIALSLAAMGDFMIAVDGGGFTTAVCQRGDVKKISQC